jgi:hypothetical protein
MKIREKFFKVLSRNDVGECHNSHQSGMSINKIAAKSEAFPKMSTTELNPRCTVRFLDDDGEEWECQYIYYNDLLFGKPSGKGHNEFRLTCIKDILRKYDVHSGDEVWFGIDEYGIRHIGFVKQEVQKQEVTKDEEGVVVIRLSNNWKTIQFK